MSSNDTIPLFNQLLQCNESNTCKGQYPVDVCLPGWSLIGLSIRKGGVCLFSSYPSSLESVHGTNLEAWVAP